MNSRDAGDFPGHGAAAPRRHVYQDSLCKEVKYKIRTAFLDVESDNAEALSSMSATRFMPVRESDYNVLRDVR